MTSITLPVSIGEAIDKLTILDIKCKKITNAAHSKKEYDLLYEILREHVETYRFHYNLLYKVNEEIWDAQDVLRAMKVPDGQLCIDILNKNDIRFRIKNSINTLTNSALREQKGYPARRALFRSRLDLCGHIELIGTVRYAALQHDEVDVCVHPDNYETLKAIYADNPSIKLLVVHDSITPSEYTTVYSAPNDTDRSYFHIPKTSRMEELYKKVKHMKYIFVEQTSSVTWNRNEIFTIDPHVNIYSTEDPWYELAGGFVNLPFLDYMTVLQNAEELYTTDSAFRCLARYIRPSRNQSS